MLVYNVVNNLVMDKNTKPWFGSKTILVLLAALIIQVANVFFGAGLEEELADKIANLPWEKPVTAFLLLLGIVFRTMAKEKVEGVGTFFSKLWTSIFGSKKQK